MLFAKIANTKLKKWKRERANKSDRRRRAQMMAEKLLCINDRLSFSTVYECVVVVCGKCIFTLFDFVESPKKTPVWKNEPTEKVRESMRCLLFFFRRLWGILAVFFSLHFVHWMVVLAMVGTLTTFGAHRAHKLFFSSSKTNTHFVAPSYTRTHTQTRNKTKLYKNLFLMLEHALYLYYVFHITRNARLTVVYTHLQYRSRSTRSLSSVPLLRYAWRAQQIHIIFIANVHRNGCFSLFHSIWNGGYREVQAKLESHQCFEPSGLPAMPCHIEGSGGGGGGRSSICYSIRWNLFA